MLSRYVEEEFEAYLKCWRLEHGFIRVRSESCLAKKLVATSTAAQLNPAMEKFRLFGES